MDPRALSIADFYEGHDSDPLKAPEGYAEWRRATHLEQALYQRPLASRAGPRCQLLVDGKPTDVLNLASLDYLDLNADPQVCRAMQEALEIWGTGACGVPMLTGTSTIQREVEQAVASLTAQESAMLFSSGFAGGIGLMGGLLRRGDVAIADEKAHICWMDGVRMAGARLITFRHNDAEHLAQQLEAHRDRRRLVVVDGLYSMDGDVAELPALLDVADAHGVGLIVDEAHSAFALGPRGGGVTAAQGMNGRVRLYFGTFSKALSIVGAFAAGPHDLIEYAKPFAHPFGFSAALPPAVLAGIRTAIDIAGQADDRRRRLQESARYLREGLQAMGLSTGASSTHVIPVMLGNDKGRLYDGAIALLKRGVYVVPIGFPAVPMDALRLRVAVTAGHTREDLDEALNAFEDCIARR